MTKKTATQRANYTHYETVTSAARLLGNVGKIAPMQLAKYGFYFYGSKGNYHVILLPEKDIYR